MSEKNKSDSVLISKIRQGDEYAFKMLFEKYYPRLCSFAYRYVKNRSRAEDVVQEIFVRLWERREKIDHGRGMQSYLYRAVRNEALNNLKHHSAEQDAIEELTYQNDGPRSIWETKEEMSSDQAEKLFQEGLSQLPEKCREIFLLSRNEGLTYKEIAGVLDISVKTVETQIGRALKKFRTYFANHPHIWPYVLAFLVLS